MPVAHRRLAPFGALLITIATTAAARADVLPPPIERGDSVPIGRLNSGLVMMQSRGTPIRLIYEDRHDIDVTIPQRIATQAENCGLTATPRSRVAAADGWMFAKVGVGAALTLCVVAAFLWLARRPSWVALACTGLMLVAVAAVLAIMLFIHVFDGAANQPSSSGAAAKEASVIIRLVEDDDTIRVRLPRSYRPAWMGPTTETTYPSPLRPRPSRPGPPIKDKN